MVFLDIAYTGYRFVYSIFNKWIIRHGYRMNTLTLVWANIEYNTILRVYFQDQKVHVQIFISQQRKFVEIICWQYTIKMS